jgi:hypothetical protein
MVRSAKPNMASQKVRMGGFYESLYYIVLRCLSFVNIYLSLFCVPEGAITTAAIHAAGSLALLNRLAAASTSLGNGSAFGAAVKSTTAGCVKPRALDDVWRPPERRVRDQDRIVLVCEDARSSEK